MPGVHTSSIAAPGALTPEAASAATGDIPDNQVFLVFRNPRAGYSMKYPEGWAQRGAGSVVTFQDKNNLIRVVVARGALPTASEARRQLARLHAQTPGARSGTASPLVLAGGRALRTGYTTRSAPSPVTGKRVTLTVDRYYLARGGKLAVVDLGTPRGVDNVDAYRLIIHSFQWS
jgi:hypothetical protein